MPYFDNDPQSGEQYQPVFHTGREDDVQDGYDDPEDGYYDMEDADLYTEEERAEARRSKWRMLAGVGDFFSVIAGTVVILLLTALLISLITWVQADISQTFVLLQTKM